MTNKPNTTRWSISKYAKEIYIPERLNHPQRPITDNTAKYYRGAISKFESVNGPTLLRSITEEVLENFSAKLIAQGCTEDLAKKYDEIIRFVVRHWRPGSLATKVKMTGNPDMKFAYADQPGTLDHLFFDRYLPSNTKLASAKTITQYGKAIRRYSEFLQEPATTAHLTDEMLGSFLRWLVEVKGVRAVTANGEVKQIKAIWNWAAKKRLVELFPTIGKLPEPERVPESWSETELLAIFNACREADGWIAQSKASDYWTAFHLVIWDTGERTGAMRELRWEWLDADTSTLTVPGEFRKGGVKAMVYRLKPATLEHIERLRPAGQNRIFEFDLTNAMFYHKYRRLIESAGLTYDRKSGPQKMRRTYASFIEKLGGNATRALRHSSRRVTEDSYIDPRIAGIEPENVRLPDMGCEGELPKQAPEPDVDLDTPDSSDWL